MDIRINPNKQTPILRGDQEAVSEAAQSPFRKTSEKVAAFGNGRIVALSKQGKAGLRVIVPGNQLGRCAQLINRIMAVWDELDPETLDDEIRDLERRVGHIQAPSAELQKIKAKVEGLRFKYEHPILRELDGDVKQSFLAQVRRVAKQIRKENSLLPFAQLNEEQRRGVIKSASLLQGEG